MTRHYLGLSSGSGLLGVDAALVRVDGAGADLALKLEHFLHTPFSPELRDLLLRVTPNPTPEARHLGILHRVLGETCALAAKQLLTQARFPAQEVLAIGCPGQSFWHDGAGRYPSTLNLGMAAVVAERTGLTTLSDFATRDLAVGGVGAPITALVDARLFQHATEDRVLIRLGTTASVLSIPARENGRWRKAIGFEAGPCTMLLDGLMRLLTHGREHFDTGGKHAVQGRCLDSLLEQWLRNHYFQQEPPKSVSRQEFGPDFLSRSIEQAKRVNGNLHDVLCTMTHFVAQAIIRSLRDHLPAAPARVLLAGRGVRNGFLWNLLEQNLAPIPVARTDAHGFPSDACKAVAYAGLTALAMDGVPANLSSATGASGARLLGQFTPGSPANWARCLAYMAHQAAPMQAYAA